MNTILYRSVVSILLVATCAVFTAGKPSADELSLVVTIVTGERGRDSNSTTTTLTLSGVKLAYQQSYHGAHSSGRTPVKKEYTLTTAERAELIKLLREKNLLVTRTLATLSPEEEPRSYFSVFIRSKLNAKEHSTTISLPRDASRLKGDPIYRDSMSLIDQLYRIINRTDPDISRPELIH